MNPQYFKDSFITEMGDPLGVYTVEIVIYNSLFDKMWTTFASRIQPNTFEIYRLKQSK